MVRQAHHEEVAAFDRTTRAVPLAELGRGECRFAVNDAAVGEPHLFCGASAQPGLPYCRHHARRAYGDSALRGSPIGLAPQDEGGAS